MTKKTRQIADVIIESGDTPLEGLMKIARDLTVDVAIRVDALGKAAPFVHPRLHAMTVATVDAPPRAAMVQVSPVPTNHYLSADEVRRLNGNPSLLIEDEGIRIGDDDETPDTAA